MSLSYAPSDLDVGDIIFEGSAVGLFDFYETVKNETTGEDEEQPAAMSWSLPREESGIALLAEGKEIGNGKLTVRHTPSGAKVEANAGVAEVTLTLAEKAWGMNDFSSVEDSGEDQSTQQSWFVLWTTDIHRYRVKVVPSTATVKNVKIENVGETSSATTAGQYDIITTTTKGTYNNLQAVVSLDGGTIETKPINVSSHEVSDVSWEDVNPGRKVYDDYFGTDELALATLSSNQIYPDFSNPTLNQGRAVITIDPAIPQGRSGTLRAKLFNQNTQNNNEISIVKNNILVFEITSTTGTFSFPGNRQKCLIEIASSVSKNANTILAVHPRSGIIDNSTRSGDTISCGSHGAIGKLQSPRLDVINITPLLNRVVFSGSHHHLVVVDGSTGIYLPHWKDNSVPPNGNANDPGDEKNPICYTRNTKARVLAQWKVDAGTNIPPNVKVRGTGDCSIPIISAIVSGNTITLPETESSKSFPNNVRRIEKMTINWQLSFDGGNIWKDVGTSENECFITLVDPQSTTFRTVLYQACKNGGTDTNSCLNNTWNSFSGPANVQRWNRTTNDGYNVDLHYYKTWNGGRVTNTMLLLGGDDGQCHAWAKFFQDCLLINGVASKITLVIPANRNYDIFAVKNIDFPTSPTYPSERYWKYSDADIESGVGAAGIKGQNTDPPKAKLFERHFIVHPVGVSTYYDPSYGVITNNAKNYTSKAVDAWRRSSDFKWSKSGWWYILSFTDRP